MWVVSLFSTVICSALIWDPLVVGLLAVISVYTMGNFDDQVIHDDDVGDSKLDDHKGLVRVRPAGGTVVGGNARHGDGARLGTVVGPNAAPRPIVRITASAIREQKQRAEVNQRMEAIAKRLAHYSVFCKDLGTHGGTKHAWGSTKHAVHLTRCRNPHF